MRARSKTRPPAAGTHDVPAFAVVLVDQTPLRSAAAAECGALRSQLDDARAAWHRFEREDKPSFARWRAREFGAVLSQLREIEAQIREQELLVHDVEMEMRRGFYDPQSAYARVISRRGNGPPPPPEPPPQATATGRVVSEFEQEALFHDWVHKFIGTDPDKLDDDAYEMTFAAFKTHMFRSRPAEPPRVRNVAEYIREHAPAPEEEAPETPTDARVKELYRMLVRRLHPDLRADGHAAASALWHEVQEAYAATDVAQLEILLALCEIESNPFSEATSVAQMRAVVADLERSLYALNDSLRQARDEDAWDFARQGADPHLQERTERELRATLRMRTERLTLLKQTIASWSRPSLARQAAFR